MWIGTQDGLNSFDGKSFKHFVSDQHDTNSLSNQYILKIDEDRKGNLWIGTAYGLNRLNPLTGNVNRVFINAENEEQHSSSGYKNYFVDQHDNIIVLHKGVIYSINQGSLQATKLQAGPVNRLFETSDQQRQFIISHDSVIDFKQPENGFYFGNYFKTNQLADVCANQQFILFYIDRPGFKILIYHLKQHKFTDSISLPSKAFDIDILSDNTIHVGLNNGFCTYRKLHEEELLQYDPANPQSLPSGPVLCSYTDRKQNLWIGTSSSGIAVQPSNFSNFILIPGVHKNDAIQDISLNTGQVIIGSNTGVYRVNNGSMQLIRDFGSNRVNAVYASDDMMYVAVEQKGLCLLSRSGSVLKWFNTDNSALESNQIFSIKKAGKEIALCTEKYFYKISDQLNISKIHVESAPGTFSYILNCNTHTNGNVYLATNSGIAILDQNGLTQKLIPSISRTDLFGKTIVSNVVPLGDSCWVSTLSNGIFLLKNNRVIQHYYLHHGLQNNVVYTIGITSHGTVWACTNAGIARLARGQTNFKTLSMHDGLPPSYYSFGSMQCRDDSIFVGTDNGLYVGDDFNMRITESRFVPYISKILIHGVNLSTIDSIMEIDVFKKNIEINFGHPTIFDNTQFAYQLNNLPWQLLPPNQMRINFSDFPFGKNTLKIKCGTNAESLLKAPYRTCVFYAKTPWHRSWWFLLLAGLSVISVLFYLLKNYFKRKNEQKLQVYQSELKLQKERERISRDLHDNLGSYATALLSKIQQMKINNENQDLNEMNELGNNIIANIRETIWIMQTSEIKIQDFSDKIKNYILKLKTVYQYLNMKVLDQIETNPSLTPTITTNLFRIVQEAVHNSVKHANASELLIRIQSTTLIEITIEDNGTGYNPAGTNDQYGIQNMRDRATDIGYVFDIVNTGKGTLVRLKNNS